MTPSQPQEWNDRTITIHCSICLQQETAIKKPQIMLRTAPKLSNSTNKVSAHSLRHQTSASLARLLLKRHHNSPPPRLLHNSKLRQESGELCSLYSIIPAKLADVWCLELYAAALFVLLLKFGAVPSIICGFLMAVSCWRHILQCIVIVWSFQRLLKLCKQAVCKLDLSRGGVLLCVTVC